MSAPSKPAQSLRQAPDLLLRSAALNRLGEPRFLLPIPKALMHDPGIEYLVRHESMYLGYEAPTREFLDRHLQPGDVFIDVGAHWGVFTLSVASLYPGQIQTLAIEPDPLNILQLIKGIALNGTQSCAEVVAAACGACMQTRRIRKDSTMGHSLSELGSHVNRSPSLLTVPVIPLDNLIAERAHFLGKRIYLKIDVEGYESEVIRGVSRLLQRGNVAAVIWEKGTTYNLDGGVLTSRAF